MKEIIEEFKKITQEILEGFKRDIAGIRANRPSAALVENIKVNYYNQSLSLKQISSISIAGPREIIIQVWDKEAAGSAGQAIESSSLGVSIKIDGNTVRIFLPALSEERREELIKHAKRISEDARIKLRRERDELNKKLSSLLAEKKISEDDKFKLKETIQDRTDETNKKIEEVLEVKIKEIKE